jgi:hypothetical protein
MDLAFTSLGGTMQFDVHLTGTYRGVVLDALTERGVVFLDDKSFETTIPQAREIYQEATEQGLQVSFDTAETRDLIAAVR